MCKIILALSFIFLVACGHNQPQTRPQETIIHPVWPNSVSSYKFNWVVVVDGNNPIVGLEYNQSVEFRLFMEDMKRYIKEQNEMLCYYRDKLKESRCKKEP